MQHIADAVRLGGVRQVAVTRGERPQDAPDSGVVGQHDPVRSQPHLQLRVVAADHPQPRSQHR